MYSQKKELVSVRIPKELNKKFAEHVAPLGLSKNAFILNLINQELRNSTAISDSPNSDSRNFQKNL